MQQMSFIPVKLAHEEPYRGQSKDLGRVGYTATRVRYAVKREDDIARLPISEWIGYHLCAACRIPTPEFAIVECLDEVVAFGSRWEETAVQITNTMSQVDMIMLIKRHASSISEVYGPDLFYGNVDRHFGNFLFVPRGGEQVLLALDYSRAGPAFAPPFGPFPMPENSTTAGAHAFMTDQKIFDQSTFKDALDSLKGLSDDWLKRVLDAAPSDWFVSVDKQQLLDWWDNDRSARLSEIHS